MAPRAPAVKEQGLSEAVAARIEAPKRGSIRSVYVKGQSWGFTSRSTARVILGQVLRIATCGT